MPLKQFTTDFQELTKHQYLRFDEKFWFTTKNLATYDYALLKDIFYLLNGNSYTEFYTEEKTDIPYVRIGDLSFKHNIDDKNLIYLDESCEINEDKKLRKDDLILATIGATIGKINLAREFEGGTFSNNTILLRLKDKEKHNPYFYEKLFQSNLLQKYIWGVVSQKAQPNLQSYDLKNVKIPLVAKSIQDQIVAQIEPIEKKIKELKNQITPPQEIINKVFAREFGFDLEKFEELKKERFFETDISEITTSLIRSTVVQNSSRTRFLKSFLKRDTIFLKDILTKPIKRGKQPEYTEGGIKVIKTLNIQKGQIVFDEVQFVSESFLKDNEEKAGVYKDDMLLTSTGMGRGKFALYDDEETCFADSHISIIRFNKQRILPYFLNYYCQSFFGTEQLKYIEMHIKGTPEIYEAQLNYFQIPDIPLKSQQKIVDEIKTELDKQEEMKKKIETQRNKIDEIIEKAVI